jgi:ABC-type nitrate/sulfonate/bicarbonate transport system substrate-binding protein
MNKMMTLAAALLCVLAVGCGAFSRMTQSPPPATASVDSPINRGTLRVEVPADADVEDIPWLMAVDSLKEQGYEVETLSFSDTAIEIAAMAQGDLDFSSISHQQSWAAIARGAPHFTFLDKAANAAVTAAGKDIRECADLDGKSVAVPSATSVSGAMLKTYLERNCPGVKPQIVIVSGGSNRIAAMLAGEVDAANVDVEGLLKLEREEPGEFHAFIVFAEEFPGLQISSYAARRGFAKEHPEIVKDLIRAVFASRRSLQDPGRFREAITEYLDLEPDAARQAVDVYLTRELWDASGAFTLETVVTTLDFLKEYGDLPAGLEPEDVADLSYYEAVLDEIGRE